MLALAQSGEFYIHSSIVLLRLIHKSQVLPQAIPKRNPIYLLFVYSCSNA
jgi:hypothetical protein